MFLMSEVSLYLRRRPPAKLVLVRLPVALASAAVERIWQMQNSQGLIMTSAVKKVFATFPVVPFFLRSAASPPVSSFFAAVPFFARLLTHRLAVRSRANSEQLQ